MKRIFEIQKKIGAIAKTETNPHFKNTYFDINKLIDELKPLLLEQDLMVMQPIIHIDGRSAIRTVIYDSEGKEVISAEMLLPNLDDPQKMGSAITYYRRYSLVSMFFLQAEDDDGNKAVVKAVAKAKTSQPIQGEFGNCQDCNAPKIKSPTKGTIYCSEKCWLSPQSKPPVPEYTGEPMYEEVPF